MKVIITWWIELLAMFCTDDPPEMQCPVCGYYCLGNGGLGCIDKPGTSNLMTGINCQETVK